MRSFVQVVRSGSISRAAAQLNIAQPALSRQMQKLEDEIGLKLVRRHGRGVTATAAGGVLLDRAEALLRQFDQLSEEVRHAEQGVTGHVVLGVPPAAGLLIAPEAVKLFRQRYPNASLQIREGISSLLEEWLLDRRVDVAVLHNPPALDGIAIVSVLRERMVLAGPPSADPAAAQPVRLAELGGVQLILPSLPHANRRLVEQAAAQHRIRLHLALEVDSVPLTKAMVQGGLGSTILTLAGVARELATGQLSVRPIHRPPLHSVIAIGQQQSSRGSLVSSTAAVTREVIGALVASGAWPGARLLGVAAHAVSPPPAPLRRRMA